MKKLLFSVPLVLVALLAKAQRVDSIYFHLYTDSLKKGTHNYINVDGKLPDGKWKPLTSKEIEFTASSCTFSGNELIIPVNFREEKITVKAVLKANPTLWIEKTIWIKKLPDPELLPGNEDSLKKKKKG